MNSPSQHSHSPFWNWTEAQGPTVTNPPSFSLLHSWNLSAWHCYPAAHSLLLQSSPPCKLEEQPRAAGGTAFKHTSEERRLPLVGRGCCSDAQNTSSTQPWRAVLLQIFSALHLLSLPKPLCLCHFFTLLCLRQATPCSRKSANSFLSVLTLETEIVFHV